MIKMTTLSDPRRDIGVLPALGLLVAAGCLLVPVAGRAQTTAPFAELKTNAGEILLTVTNYGRYGNDFRSRESSFEFPAGTGHEHMTRGGIWIGGVTVSDFGDVDTLVTTSVVDAYQGSAAGTGTEFTPRYDPSWPPLPPGTHFLERSALISSRYYSQDAIADQELIAVFDDAVPIGDPGSADPHLPLRVKVRQEVLVWGFAPFNGIVFANYEVTNIDPSRDLFNVYVGFYTELTSGNKNAIDRWPPGGQWYGAKDIGFVDSLRLVTEHRAITDVLYASSWCGMQLLGTSPLETDSLDFTFVWWDWNPQAGNRNSDPERYRFMASGSISATDLNEAASGLDPTCLVAAGPFPVLGAAETDTVRFSVAFLGGADRADLINHAQHALNAYLKGFRIAVPPPPPRYMIESGPQEITIRWDDSPEYARDAETDSLDFEGYRIYVARTGATSSFDLIKEADVVDDFWFEAEVSQEDLRFNTGLGSLVAEDPITVIEGADTVTYKYKYVLRNLRDGFRYWTAITSFDRGALEIGPLESGIGLTRRMVIPGTTPARPDGRGSGVGVFPNPYRGDAAWDGSDRRDRYLWFTNLPRRCTIRIYTLGGDLVDKIDFDGDRYDARDIRGIYDPTDRQNPELDLPILPGGTAAWDLITQHDQAVATGLYLFSVEDLDTGRREIGRFLVIK